MKKKSASQSAFFDPRVSIGFALCSAGVLLALAEWSNSVTGMMAPTGTVNPVPLINQPLVPDAVAPGGAGFTLTVNGTGFVSGSAVNWNGSARATTFVNGSQLTAAILASDIATASTASVTVVNPSPGGGSSNVVFFPITITTSTVSLSRSDYGTGSGPVSVVTADFNRDGILDLAVANQGSNMISILLGNGDGTFQPHVDYPTGPTFYIAVGEFNDDGNVDLVTGGPPFSSGTVSVLLGNGDGTFQGYVDYAAGPNPLNMTTGDFNEDGKLDLVVTEWFGSNTVAVLLGNGDGSFQPPIQYATATTPNIVTTADFNSDGNLDLAVTTYANVVSILLGNGDGTFEAHRDFRTGHTSGGIVAADLNGDSKLDLAVCNQSDDTLAVLLGNGDGTFDAPVDYPTPDNPAIVTAGDFNGDGNLDVATDNSLAGNISILLGNGDGTLQTHVDYAIGGPSLTVTTGDFNGDGRLDFAANNGTVNTVSIFLQSTTVALSDTSLSFGLQLVGTHSSAQTVTLTNAGPITLTISSITASGDFLRENNCGSSLPPGASCTVNVAFAPTTKGPRTGALTITDNAPDSPQTVVLMGTGTVVQLAPMNVNFGNQRVGTTSRPHTVTLTNIGDTPLNIRGIAILGANFGDFVETTTCGSSVPAHTSCEIDVRFSPTATGPREASLRVRDDGGGGTQDVKLGGTGVSN